MLRAQYNLLRDLAIIGLGIAAAVLLAGSGLVEEILVRTEGSVLVGSFVAGFFFTSIFTVAPATVVLVNLFQTASFLPIVLIAALGAVSGDLIIFRFFRDRITTDLVNFIHSLHRRSPHRRFHRFHPLRLFWLVVGGLVIASPLPNELGLAILGLSRLPTPLLTGVSFIFELIGLVIIGLVARAIL